jgi:polysaccharide export outer membrane protein
VIRISSLIASGFLFLLLAACGGPRPTSLPHGQEAYAVVPAPPEVAPPPVLRQLQAGDAITVKVFREPDLGVEKAVLDELGYVQLPLVGQVQAAGQTPVELSRQIEQRLGQRYLRNPKVTVAITSAIPRTVTVEGQVAGPGVFPLGRNDTLITTLARAGSPTELAKLDEVMVFRTVNGQRMGAVFDVRKIRVGAAPDPQIIDGDVVVVGYSSLRGGFRDFLSVFPVLSLFTRF